MIEHPLEPIIDEQCEVLILGSFPSVKSREISQIVDKLDENINWAIPNWYFHFLLA